MLYETVFHFAISVFAHCRDSFHDTTGLMLPDDETNPLLHNKESISGRHGSNGETCHGAMAH